MKFLLGACVSLVCRHRWPSHSSTTSLLVTLKSCLKSRCPYSTSTSAPLEYIHVSVNPFPPFIWSHTNVYLPPIHLSTRLHLVDWYTSLFETGLGAERIVFTVLGVDGKKKQDRCACWREVRSSYSSIPFESGLLIRNLHYIDFVLLSEKQNKKFPFLH